ATLSSSESDQIIIATKNGMAIRFPLKDVRQMGRSAMGVIGIRLREKDEVVGMVNVPDENCEILTITVRGFGKRTPVNDYRVQSRGGVGIKTMPGVEKAGQLCGIDIVADPKSDVIVMTKNGQSIRFNLSTVSQLSRTARGVKIVDLSGDDEVSHFAVVEACTEN
ncbi:DNA gyrase C-terminal beta-propeller domain-containing protein, partial [Pseudothermotoga sp.]|uniref:DNA gyrase C-terminal beta-propeller domain-containing protein n=1 Tax=Pseudothermotoga sp. TaxID=2033661 RepID=UPI000E839990